MCEFEPHPQYEALSTEGGLDPDECAVVVVVVVALVELCCVCVTPGLLGKR